jgi:hypothetical protein
MSAHASEFSRIEAWLSGQVAERWSLTDLLAQLNSLAGTFRRTPVAEHREIIASFHDIAGRLPYFYDSDIGALVLESAADAEVDARLRQFLYTEALYRARWCASAASAGGEGIARSRHISQLELKLVTPPNKSLERGA